MSDQMTRITTVGPTGSVDRLSVDIQRRLPARCRMAGLADGSNLTRISQYVAEIRPTQVTTPQPVPE